MHVTLSHMVMRSVLMTEQTRVRASWRFYLRRSARNPVRHGRACLNHSGEKQARYLTSRTANSPCSSSMRRPLPPSSWPAMNSRQKSGASGQHWVARVTCYHLARAALAGAPHQSATVAIYWNKARCRRVMSNKQSCRQSYQVQGHYQTPFQHCLHGA